VGNDRIRRLVLAVMTAEDLATMSNGAQLALAEDPNTDPDILAALAPNAGYDMKSALAQNPSTPRMALITLSNQAEELQDILTFQYLMARPDYPDEYAIHVITEYPGRWAARLGMIRANPSPEFMQALSDRLEQEDASDLYGLVKDTRDATPEVLRMLAGPTFAHLGYVRGAVANHPVTPPDILKDLATNGDVGIQGQVGRNPNAPAEVLAQLATSTDPHVRVSVAENTNTPPEVLGSMVQDDKEFVLSVLGENPNTPPEALATLATSDQLFVLTSVVRNPKAPTETLRLILDRLAGPGDTWAGGLDPSDSRHILGSMAENPNASEEILQDLIDMGEYRIWQAVGRNKSLTPGLSEVLAEKYRQKWWDGDSYSDNMGATDLAKNPITTDKALMRLIPVPGAAKAMSDRDDLSPAVVSELTARFNMDRPHDFKLDRPYEGPRRTKEVEHLHWLRGVLKGMGVEEITWQAFKKAYPTQESFFKSFFMAHKGVVTLDNVEDALHGPEKDLVEEGDVSYGYSKWNGMQRHLEDRDNLVIQLNFKPEYVQNLKSDPEFWAFYRKFNSYFRGHPILPMPGHTFAWARVTQLDDGSWLIDEIQSDLDAESGVILHSLNSYGTMPTKYENKVEPKPEYLTRIKQMVKSWEDLAMSAVLEHARSSGITDVYMHTSATKGHITSPEKRSKMYEQLPKAYRFNKVKVDVGKGDEMMWHRKAKRVQSNPGFEKP
jgi:hypothetical protein